MTMLPMKKKEIKKFNRTVHKLQKKLGLQEWEIVWTEGGPHSHTVTNEYRAAIHIERTGRVATLVVSPFNDDLPKRLVFHELLHLLFADLRSWATRGVDEQYHKEIDTIEHSIIQRLESLL